MADDIMTEEQFAELIALAETCVRDDFYFEVTGEDRDMVLKALKAYKLGASPSEPGACTCRPRYTQGCPVHGIMPPTHVQSSQGASQDASSGESLKGLPSNPADLAATGNNWKPEWPK